MVKNIPVNIPDTYNVKKKVGMFDKNLPNASSYNNPPTSEQLSKYKQNKKEILDPIVISSLKKHPSDVLHGSQSLKRVMPEFFKREPNDWDFYSDQEEKRALALEKSLDTKMKSDFAYTVKGKIPQVTTGTPNPKAFNASKLYEVKVRGVTDPQIEVMDKPKGLPTFSFGGITHESLESQHYKLDFRASNSLTKMIKGIGDRNAIEDYLKSKGKKVPERTHGMTQKRKV